MGEYSTCAIAHEGSLSLFTDNEASISCFNYLHAGKPELRAWVERFCKFHNITGTVCIDFFVTAKGEAIAIECNPRFSSNKKDAYYDPNDVMPFLALHFVHIPTLLARNIWRGN